MTSDYTRGELFNLFFLCVLQWGRSWMDHLDTMQIPPPPSLLPRITAEVQTAAGAQWNPFSSCGPLPTSTPRSLLFWLVFSKTPLQRFEASGQSAAGFTGSCGEERIVQTSFQTASASRLTAWFLQEGGAVLFDCHTDLKEHRKLNMTLFRFVYSSSTDATGFQTHQLLSKQLLRRPHWVEW